MAAHQFLFVSLESLGFHEDPVFDADLADVVKHPSELNVLNLAFRQADLTRNCARDARYTIRMASGKAILGINRLGQSTHCSEEELTRFCVLAKGEPGQVERNEEEHYRPKTD